MGDELAFLAAMGDEGTVPSVDKKPMRKKKENTEEKKPGMRKKKSEATGDDKNKGKMKKQKLASRKGGAAASSSKGKKEDEKKGASAPVKKKEAKKAAKIVKLKAMKIAKLKPKVGRAIGSKPKKPMKRPAVGALSMKEGIEEDDEGGPRKKKEVKKQKKVDGTSQQVAAAVVEPDRKPYRYWLSASNSEEWGKHCEWALKQITERTDANVLEGMQRLQGTGCWIKCSQCSSMLPKMLGMPNMNQGWRGWHHSGEPTPEVFEVPDLSHGCPICQPERHVESPESTVGA